MKPIDKLRPHHILCERYLEFDISGRGETFIKMSTAVKEFLAADGDQEIELIEGIDGLCRSCPECRNERCDSSFGNEDQVRRLDGIVLKGLGLSYGDTRTVAKLNKLIRANAPLPFCRTKCPWRDECTIFQLSG